MKLKMYAASLLVFVALLATNTYAQMPGTSPIDLHNPQQPDIPGSKISGVGSRYVAYSYYPSNGTVLVPSDSERYSYPGITSSLVTLTNLYNYLSGGWVKAFNYIYTYDAMGYLTSSDQQKWNTTTSTWDNYNKGTYINNAAGYAINFLSRNWNTSTSTYVNAYQYTYIRNSSNYATDYVSQLWNTTTNNWVNTYHYIYTYNAQNYATQYIAQTWNPTTNAWVNYQRYDYTYDASGTNLTSYSVVTWNTLSSTWRNTSMTTFTNNAAGRPISSLQKLWNATTSAYDNDQRTTYTYDGMGNETSEVAELWNTTTSGYANAYQVLTTYNSFGQFTSYTYLYWVSGAWSIADANAYRVNYYFENYTTSVNGQNNGEAKLSLSPSPAKEVLEIKLQWAAPQDFSVIISDMTGRTQQKFSGVATKDFKTSISVAGMAEGNYLLSVKGTNGASAMQMITVVH